MLRDAPPGGGTRQVSAVEVKCGLLDVAEGLRFLHQDAKVAHMNINPSTVFVAAQPAGRWQLGGFGSSVSIADTTAAGGLAKVEFAFSFANGRSDLDCALSPDPVLRYCAPEVTKEWPGKGGGASDVFSLGLICYECMNAGQKPLIPGSKLARNDRNGHSQIMRQILPFNKLGGKLCSFC